MSGLSQLCLERLELTGNETLEMLRLTQSSLHRELFVIWLMPGSRTEIPKQPQSNPAMLGAETEIPKQSPAVPAMLGD